MFRIFRTALFAVPFFFLWNYFAPIYGSNLPEAYLHLPFWHCVGLFALLGVVKSAVSFGHHRWHHRFGHRGYYGHVSCQHGGATYRAKFRPW